MTKSKLPTEAQEQIRLAAWLTKMGIRFTASANGGKRDILEAAKLKRQGVSAGFPDVFIPLPILPYRGNENGYHGLFLELKRVKGGKPSPQQVQWITYLREQNYWADFAYGFDEARATILHYLSLNNSDLPKVSTPVS